jgi:hypothetical protein
VWAADLMVITLAHDLSCSIDDDCANHRIRTDVATTPSRQAQGPAHVVVIARSQIHGRTTR